METHFKYYFHRTDCPVFKRREFLLSEPSRIIWCHLLSFVIHSFLLLEAHFHSESLGNPHTTSARYLSDATFSRYFKTEPLQRFGGFGEDFISELQNQSSRPLRDFNIANPFWLALFKREMNWLRNCSALLEALSQRTADDVIKLHRVFSIERRHDLRTDVNDPLIPIFRLLTSAGQQAMDQQLRIWIICSFLILKIWKDKKNKVTEKWPMKCSPI